MYKALSTCQEEVAGFTLISDTKALSLIYLLQYLHILNIWVARIGFELSTCIIPIEIFYAL